MNNLKAILILVIIPQSIIKAQELIENNEQKKIELQEKLESLSKKSIPGLKEKIDYSVSGLELKEFLRIVAEFGELNVHINEDIEGIISNNFSNERIASILLFLSEQYQLDLSFTGNIISISQRKKIEKRQIGNYYIEYSGFDNHISIQAKNDTLSSVVKEIIKKSGKNVIPAPQVREKIISSFISDMPFENAIENFAFSNGIGSQKQKDGTILLFPLQIEIEGNSISQTTGRNFNRSKSPNYGLGGYELEVIEENDEIFINAEFVSEPVFEILQDLSKKSKLNYIFFASPQIKIDLKVEKIPHDSFLEFLLQGTKFTYSKKDGVYLIGERKREGLRSSELVQFRHRSVEDLMEIIPAELSQEVEIKVFEELNGLLISGSRPKINEIKDFIYPLDRLVPLILIELVAIDVRKGRDVETGIKAGISDSVKTGGSLLPGLNFTISSSSINQLTDIINSKGIINLGKVTPNFYATLQAMEKNNHIKIRSTPKLATLNGHEASLTIGQTEYYLEQTQNIQGANNVVTTITPQYREVNADLNILIDPLVSAGDQVTLDILAEFSSFTDPYVINGPPGKSTRRFESIIRVRNEEMIVLGGLEEIRKTKQTEGVPFLSRLPVLKWLFSSVNNEKGESRLLVFIKPTIVY